MSRHYGDWLQAFVNYSSFGEAPKRLYFWVGISAIAGALRRKVWIDQVSFCWYPNLYIVLVAPPGIIAKSTTADMSMNLLREVPGIRFGPSVVTWQALVTSFAEAAEQFTDPNGVVHTMSPMTINSSEFGNLVNPKDREMIDILVHLWDGKPFTKVTKHSGNDDVVNPWINLIAATTPEWIAASFPEYMVGGGFTSRCLFVYADAKEKYVPYPHLVASKSIGVERGRLIEDLDHIARNVVGEYSLTPEAIEWGSDWYRRHYEVESKDMDPARFGGYVARKQTLAHKVAMCLAASQRDELVITQDDLATAVSMLTDLEPDMKFVFDRIGMTPEAVQSDRLAQLVKARGEISYAEVYLWMKRYFHQKTAIEDVLAAGMGAGQFHVDPGPPVKLVAGTRPISLPTYLAPPDAA